MKSFGVFVILAVLLNGCAKNATESATETTLHQIDVLQQKIEKECPKANFAAEIMALQSGVKTQLATCESRLATAKEKNNTLWAVLIGIIAVIIALNWAKLKSKIWRK